MNLGRQQSQITLVNQKSTYDSKIVNSEWSPEKEYLLNNYMIHGVVMSQVGKRYEHWFENALEDDMASTAVLIENKPERAMISSKNAFCTCIVLEIVHDDLHSGQHDTFAYKCKIVHIRCYLASLFVQMQAKTSRRYSSVSPSPRAMQHAGPSMYHRHHSRAQQQALPQDHPRHPDLHQYHHPDPRLSLAWIHCSLLQSTFASNY